jgi:hypothetical protein
MVYVYDSDDDFWYDSTSEDDIFDDEAPHWENDKVDGLYYIGTCDLTHIKRKEMYVLWATVSIDSFFKYPFAVVDRYLHRSRFASSIEQDDTETAIEIMQLDKTMDFYTVILKTVWIRLIQRRWKNILKERETITQRRKNPRSRHIFELTGRYPAEIGHFPSLRGMMSHYGRP